MPQIPQNKIISVTDNPMIQELLEKGPKVNKSVKQEKPEQSKIIAVDFDGTLCDNWWPNIGPAHNELIEVLKFLKINGIKLILWTCREEQMLMDAVAWCGEHGLKFDAVNSNLPELIERWGNDPRKIGADIYLDDRGLRWSGSDNALEMLGRLCAR